MDNLKFKHPFTCIVSGPTGSGKTVFVRRLLKNYKLLTTIKAEPLRVLYCYGQYQHGVKSDIPKVIIHAVEGLANEDEINSFRPHLIVIDDLMTELCDNNDMCTLFTKKSHHLNISVIFIVQNAFQQGKVMRTLRLNSQYDVLMKNPRDKLQITIIGKQMGNTKFIEEAFKDATSVPFGYLCIDNKNDTEDKYRIRTRLFPEENVKGEFAPFIYTAK